MLQEWEKKDCLEDNTKQKNKKKEKREAEKNVDERSEKGMRDKKINWKDARKMCKDEEKWKQLWRRDPRNSIPHDPTPHGYMDFRINYRFILLIDV